MEWERRKSTLWSGCGRGSGLGATQLQPPRRSRLAAVVKRLPRPLHDVGLQIEGVIPVVDGRRPGSSSPVPHLLLSPDGRLLQLPIQRILLVSRVDPLTHHQQNPALQHYAGLACGRRE